MFSFVKSVIPIFLISFTLASAAVVTLGGATDGSNAYSIYTLDVNGVITNQAPIAYSATANNVVYFTVNPAKNLLYLWNPWDNTCFDCMFTFDITKGGSVLTTEHIKLPINCLQAQAIDYDPKQNQLFFGCQSSFVIMTGSAMQQFNLPFTPSSVSFNSHTNTVYLTGSGDLTGSGYVHQHNIAANTSTTYQIPKTDVVTLSNVVGTSSGQAYMAAHFFNSNQQSWELEWFNIDSNKKSWLVPIKNTELKQHQALGKATFDADSQSIVWVDAQYLFKYNTVSGQITAHHITFKGNPVTWLTSFGVAALNL